MLFLASLTKFADLIPHACYVLAPGESIRGLAKSSLFEVGLLFTSREIHSYPEPFSAQCTNTCYIASWFYVGYHFPKDIIPVPPLVSHLALNRRQSTLTFRVTERPLHFAILTLLFISALTRSCSMLDTWYGLLGNNLTTRRHNHPQRNFSIVARQTFCRQVTTDSTARATRATLRLTRFSECTFWVTARAIVFWCVVRNSQCTWGGFTVSDPREVEFLACRHG